MPVTLLTLHTHGSWLADREEGYHARDHRGFRPQSLGLGHHQRMLMKCPERVCGERLQRICLEELETAATHQRLRLYVTASCDSHLHSLFGWDDDRPAEAIRRSLKRSVTLRAKACGVRPPFFSAGGDCFAVHQSEKFRFHRFAYLPDHPGWFWDAERGWRSPTRGQRLVERWRLGKAVPAGPFDGSAPRFMRASVSDEAAAAGESFRG